MENTDLIQPLHKMPLIFFKAKGWLTN